SNQACTWSEDTLEAFARVVCKERRAGACHQHRIKHHLCMAPAREASGDRRDDFGPPQHPDLGRANGEILEHSIDLRGNKFCRDRVNGAHTLCVLCGYGGDHGGAVDTESSKCLQVGLYSRSARGVRARDRQRNCGHDCRLCAKAVSTTARSSRAASIGSGLSEIAEMTAMPSAPASMVAAALLISIPAMAHTAKRGDRRRIAAARWASPVTPIGASVLVFELVGNTPPTPT